MKTRIFQYVQKFLSLRLEPGSKLLLALSGGPDSLCLFHLLLECQKLMRFELHVAHVDHRWRAESRDEAATLSRVISSHKIPFHLKVLDRIPDSDRENWCRQARLNFFRNLYDEHGFQAVLLAHHADDQAETVLKRICEGAHMRGMRGLLEERSLGGLPIWRPLLNIRKGEIEAYVDRFHLHPFDDETNRDTTFLRGRMREEIFPTLEEQFGKQIGRSFVRLGQMASELSDYFEERVVQISKRLIRGPIGYCLELQPSFHPLEVKCFIQKMAEEHGAHLSHEACEGVVELIKQNRSSHSVDAAPLSFVVNRSYLFIITELQFDFFQAPDQWKQGRRGCWKSFWQGEVTYPEKVKEIIRLDELTPTLKKKMRNWYSSHKVPPFLQAIAPVFVRDNLIVGEPLTGHALRESISLNKTKDLLNF